MRKNRGFKQFWDNNFKKIDLFGKQVSLTYKGKEKFHTSFGTLLTIIYALGMLIAITIQL